MLRQTESWEDLEQQIDVEITDVAHVVGKAEIDGVAFAKYSTIAVAGSDEKLLHDILVRDSTIGKLFYVRI